MILLKLYINIWPKVLTITCWTSYSKIFAFKNVWSFVFLFMTAWIHLFSYLVSWKWLHYYNSCTTFLCTNMLSYAYSQAPPSKPPTKQTRKENKKESKEMSLLDLDDCTFNWFTWLHFEWLWFYYQYSPFSSLCATWNLIILNSECDRIISF